MKWINLKLWDCFEIRGIKKSNLVLKYLPSLCEPNGPLTLFAQQHKVVST